MTIHEFCKNFDIVGNALSMRELARWNGRAIRNKENLSEHTHLVCACAIEIMKSLPAEFLNNKNELNVLKICMFHDSCELLRGDILSTTKDEFPEIRKLIDCEEQEFIEKMIPNANDIELEISKLADLMACYKYLEYNMCSSSNEYTMRAYVDTKEKFDNAFSDFLLKYELNDCESVTEVESRFSKGHYDDCGVDIILDSDVIILPHTTSVIDLNVSLNVTKGVTAYLCSRTSAAVKGIVIANCPIDCGYSGNIHAIVHNVSNNAIHYKKGQSFCQVVFLKSEVGLNPEVREPCKRERGNRGSTGLC